MADYETLSLAFEFFSERLFGGRLPPAMITISQGRRYSGCFRPARFLDSGFVHHSDHIISGEKSAAVFFADEISLNAAAFSDDRELYATLAHEMVHMRQQREGRPGRRGYHNRQWAEWMLEIGLQPVSHDRPGSAVGRSVSHTVIEGGAYDLAYAEWARIGPELRWVAASVLLGSG